MKNRLATQPHGLAGVRGAVALAVVVLVTSSGCGLMRPGVMASVGNCGPCSGVCGPACGCEPACGVPDCGACCAGKSMAFQKYREPCCPKKPLFNYCVGPGGPCTGGGCEPCCGCEPSCGCDDPCGCEPACGCEPGCAVEPSCGCAGPCGCGPWRPGQHVAYALSCLFAPLGGCNGCGELYWNEWHSDPPLCRDPCDCMGEWIGPSSASMRAPYDHSFSPRRIAQQPADTVVR